MKKKYVIILGDGMADYSDENGQTPLSLAKKPNIDALCANSEFGLVQTIPFGMKPGSDTANLSVMGFDPRECYTGRSPLEAVSMGIVLDETCVTYRVNLVTLSDEPNFSDKKMVDYSAGEITTEESRELMKAIAKELNSDSLTFYGGISYRHCLVRKNGKTGGIHTPPHDISGKVIGEYLPKGEFSNELLELMSKAAEILKNHPVNIKRIESGKKPANSIWPWGEGTKPRLNSFKETFGISGAVISAVDLIKGIAISAKMQSIDVEGATGNLHTNFIGKAEAALNALKTNDLVYVHIEAPDECGHQGDKAGKIKAIEKIDELVVKTIVNKLTESKTPFRLLFVPDHATPICKMTHTMDPVPYLIYDSELKQKGSPSYTEEAAKKTGILLEKGADLMKLLVKL